MLNLAFIGSKIAAERYGSIMNRIDGARWFAFVPLNEGRSSKGNDLLGATIEEESMESLLKHHLNKVDAIVIHANSALLQNLAKVATQSGKPVLAGPLLASNTEELNALTMASGEGLLVPACAWRFIPAIQSVKASIDAGNLGEIGLIRMHRWNSKTTEKHSDIPGRIIPAIDLATWFFNDRPKKIFSLKSPTIHEYIQVHLQFKNGGMVVIDETGALPEGGDYFSLSVIGGKGAAYADDHRNMNLIVDGVYPHAMRTGQGAINIAGQLQAFVNTVKSEAPPPLTQQDVLHVLQVSDAVIAASAVNKVSV